MEARVSIIKNVWKEKQPSVRSTLIWTNKEKYEALVRAYHRDLFRYAYWLCKDKSIAEDLVQTSCMEVTR